jgi:hypothetical protein
MASMVTMRLDPETRTRVKRLARRKRIPFSHAMRIALREWAAREERELTPYEKVSHLIGIARGNDPTRSQDIGRKMAKLLKRRRGRR